jgi:hypothetical protein
MMKQSIGNFLENIEELIHDYIKNSYSIMVAVQAFNSPIVTSDSLKLATEIDPEGCQSIGCCDEIESAGSQFRHLRGLN